MPEISLKDARRLVLAAQGLDRSNPFGKKENGLLGTLDALGYIQIDTISVVSRAHHHSLWTRVPDYDQEMLFRLQREDKSIFEYWSHAAAYLPISDFRFSLPTKLAFAKGKKHWFNVDKKVYKYVLERIQSEGPLMSKDFEAKKKGAGIWYEFKPAKIALNQLFIEGKIMISERRGFQKVYDLPERILPAWIDTSIPSEEEMAEHLITRSINCHALIRDKEIWYLRKGWSAKIRKQLDKMLKEGRIIKVKVKGLEGQKFYTFPEKLELLESRSRPRRLHILCPFDNLIIQRNRMIDLFGFDYKLECYVPAAKRQKGYYLLPVLWGDQFVAQIDAKADRKSGKLLIKSFHLEVPEKKAEAFMPALTAKLEDYARFNGCEFEWGV